MSQDQVSGAAADKWGRETARAIAAKIGAEMVSNVSNECVYDNSKAVIKCAKVATDSVGVTYKMLERLDFILGAFQAENNNFDIYRLPATHFESQMRATASQGTAHGKVGIVRKSVFESKGTHIGAVVL